MYLNDVCVWIKCVNHGRKRSDVVWKGQHWDTAGGGLAARVLLCPPPDLEGASCSSIIQSTRLPCCYAFTNEHLLVIFMIKTAKNIERIVFLSWKLLSFLNSQNM